MTAAPTAPTELGTILSIWAHPDDETWLAAGIMAAARDHGQRVVCVSATAGEHGTADPVTWPPERLGAVRRWETAAAMAILGVDEHHILGMPDGGLADLDRAGIAWAGRMLDHVQPDTILTFDADGQTFHPDHIAVHRWVTRAWHECGCRSRLLYSTATVENIEGFLRLREQWNVYMTEDRPTGVPPEQLAVHVRLDGLQLDRKLAALRTMATQIGDVVAAIGPELFAALLAEESFLDAARNPDFDSASRSITAAT